MTLPPVSHALVATIAPSPPTCPQPSILIDVTVPQFQGWAARIVMAALGIQDIAAMFAEARVGDVRSIAGRSHATFRLALDHGLEVGGTTRMGPVLVGNDGGQLRITLPQSWGGVARAKGLHPTDGVEPDGSRVCRLWVDPRSGQSVQIPIPVGAPGAYFIRVEVVGTE